MKSLTELESLHKRRVTWLQNHCLHTYADWTDYMWAPGPYGGQAKVCRNCGKELDRKDYESSASTSILSPEGLTVWNEGRVNLYEQRSIVAPAKQNKGN